MQTYEVTLKADAYRTVRVRANSAREAADLAQQRVIPKGAISARGWHVDQGAMSHEEAVSVWLGEDPMGPDGAERFEDEEASDGD